MQSTCIGALEIASSQPCNSRYVPYDAKTGGSLSAQQIICADMEVARGSAWC